MLGILGLGFLLGMQHALEADHIAAVSSIAARHASVGEIVRRGLAWGLGHTITLFLFAGAALLLDRAIPEHLADLLQTAVGIMLVALGSNVLWRVWHDRAHFHQHRHVDGTVHLHLHSHAGEGSSRARDLHSHEHGFRWQALFVGLMHGMAGSAALLVLVVSQAGNPRLGLIYVFVFGLGSMIGMGALSAAIAYPLVMSARYLVWANRGLQLLVGIITIAIGAMTIHETLFS